ncbi:MAG TPA: c-type cytochrome [Burkholderiales bacterium]|nr:c-type cytochrome [Burkholderiales bacterium]
MAGPDATGRAGCARRAAAVLLCAASLCGVAAARAERDTPRTAARLAACEACHGTAGRPPLAGTPSLSGQQREFLALQMFLFREGLREAAQMAKTMDGLTDNDLLEIASYFARQPPPRADGKKDPGLYARGAALSRAMGCGGCHGEDFRGQQHVPRLANQREDYLAAAMKAYRDNRRTGIDTTMNGILYRVPDADLEALAHFLAHR